jgi:hypothetical protein
MLPFRPLANSPKKEIIKFCSSTRQMYLFNFNFSEVQHSFPPVENQRCDIACPSEIVMCCSVRATSADHSKDPTQRVAALRGRLVPGAERIAISPWTSWQDPPHQPANLFPWSEGRYWSEVYSIHHREFEVTKGRSLVSSTSIFDIPSVSRKVTVSTGSM